ncbi:transcription antitermination factor NusB [Facklamia sp. DSM 111018]|uniref:Transcription antitermination protein NusB n=1 Tax=Facklamia lactis TaxID=2749967 RepID=A0ABS0LR77_9LACT|nr:transcription antitermination factor NusB [Facklamia lactis]MBG9980977.1 transcription antitermination factor NusB [Facklamia lactis]MBG9986660.1 transcription antitermination factor NusB [Facklamia lactis]
MVKLNRHTAREKAVQSLYQLINGIDNFESESAIAFALEAGNDPDSGIEGEVDPYLLQIVKGVNQNRMAIDKMIEDYLTKGWSLDRIASIDLTILRLAFYEVAFMEENVVPAKVAVNEAIELSKTFSDDKSRKFISGVLAKLLENQA